MSVIWRFDQLENHPAGRNEELYPAAAISDGGAGRGRGVESGSREALRLPVEIFHEIGDMVDDIDPKRERPRDRAFVRKRRDQFIAYPGPAAPELHPNIVDGITEFLGPFIESKSVAQQSPPGGEVDATIPIWSNIILSPHESKNN